MSNSGMYPLLIPLLFASGAGGGDGPRVGEPAPDLTIEQLLNAPDEASPSWPSLERRVVVLEFWATSCARCVAAIPHLNALAQEFSGKPVQFIAVTDETPAEVERFLAKSPIRGWVGIDADGSMFRSFAVPSRPHTVVVDKRGRVAAITLPHRVTDRVLDAMLAGKMDSLSEPLVEVIIRPNLGRSNMSEFSRSDRRISASNMELDALLGWVYDIPATRVSGPVELLARAYDAVVALPGAAAHGWKHVLRAALETGIGFNVRREEREMDVLVLSTPNDSAPVLQACEEKDSTHTCIDRFTATRRSMAQFSNDLEARLKRVVLDETQLSGFFKIDLFWNPDDPESLIAAVRRHLGLELKTEKRKVEVLYVEATKKQTEAAVRVQQGP